MFSPTVEEAREKNMVIKRLGLFICIGDKLFRYGDFFSEKNIVGPQEVQDPRFLVQLALTHYILGSICFRTPWRPPGLPGAPMTPGPGVGDVHFS